MHLHQDIWPKLRGLLEKRYQVIRWINIPEHNNDVNLLVLYNLFAPFRGHSFSPRERIVIVHRDTDYYTSPGDFSFTLWNLYKIFNYLDIPTEFVLMISHQPGVDQEMVKLAQEFAVAPVHTVYAPYQWVPLPEDVLPTEVEINKIRWAYLCLNGLPRSHRIYTLSKLNHHGILDRGMVTLWTMSAAYQYTENDPDAWTEDVQEPIPMDLHLRGCTTAVRINDHIKLSAQQRQEYLANRPSVFRTITHPDIFDEPNTDNTRYQPDFAKLALWNLVNETVGDYPHVHMSEKTIKAILTKRPFILLGARHSLAALKDLGFRSFDSWIDEGYDDLPTFADRADRATEGLVRYCAMNESELQGVARQMQEVLEYNFDHYIHGFGGERFGKLLASLL